MAITLSYGGRIDLTVTDALTAEMTKIGAEIAGRPLPPLAWFLRPGTEVRLLLVGMASEESVCGDRSRVVAVLTPWADVMGLAPLPDRGNGTVEWRGTWERMPVDLWGIVDRDLFDRQPDLLAAPAGKGGAR
jgi:hypothetical protein